MGKRGPKSRFTKALGEQIVAEIHGGKNMLQVAKQIGVSYDSILRWQKANNSFALAVNEARIATVYPYLDMAETLLEEATTRDEILKAKEILNQARWKAEKLLPAFQPIQKQEIEHKGPNVVVATWMPTQEVGNEGRQTRKPRASLNASADKPLKTLDNSGSGTIDVTPESVVVK